MKFGMKEFFFLEGKYMQKSSDFFFFSHFTSVTDFVILNLYEADKLEKLDTFVKKHSLLRNFPKITIMQTKCRASVSPYYNNNI